MGAEFRDADRGGGREEKHPQRKVITTADLPNYFRQVFPYYLSIGMTADEFWNGDNGLPKAFREADKDKSGFIEKKELRAIIEAFFINFLDKETVYNFDSNIKNYSIFFKFIKIAS